MRLNEICKCFPRHAPFCDGREATTDGEVWWCARVEIDRGELGGLAGLTVLCLWFGRSYILWRMLLRGWTGGLGSRGRGWQSGQPRRMRIGDAHALVEDVEETRTNGRGTVVAWIHALCNFAIKEQELSLDASVSRCDNQQLALTSLPGPIG